jgi:DNA-binding MarR family transcriptional regulator
MQSDGADETALVVDSLRRIVHGLRASSHAAERDVGVTGAQLFVLRELAAEPGVSIRRLSERTLTDPSSVSVVVARLVERGLVVRRSDEHDARRSVLVVSKQGRRLLERAPAPYQEHLIEVLRAMPRARLRSLGRMLSELVGALEPMKGAPPLFFEESPKKRARSRRVKTSR